MSSRGAFGAPTQKHRSQNVNSVFSGKNTAASKASGPNKHGGLQALGKTTTIVRRMPKPATLPSLKAEHGQDPQICLVPQGGQGWSKSSSNEQQSADSKVVGNASDASALFGSGNGPGAPDLRPNWAKQSLQGQSATGSTSAAGGPTPTSTAVLTSANAVDAQNSAQQQLTTGSGGGGSSSAQGSDYPTLAASMKTDGSQKKGYMEEAEPIIPLPSVVPPQPAGYIGASGPRISDRKLPARYYGGPDVAHRQTGQKYDFLQKMAKLSLDSSKEQQQQSASAAGKTSEKEKSAPASATPSSQSTNISSDGPAQTNDSTAQAQPTGNAPPSKHALQGHHPPLGYQQHHQQQQQHYGHQPSSESRQYYSGAGNRQRLQSSESTTDSAGVLRKRSFEPPYENYSTMSESSQQPPQGYSSQRGASHHHSAQHHHHSHPQMQHADGSLTDAQQSGRGDIGYGSQSSDIQQHQHPPSSRTTGGFDHQRSSTGGLEDMDGGGIHGGPPVGYDYSTPPPSAHHQHYQQQHHQAQSHHSASYDEQPMMTGSGYEEGNGCGGDGQQLYRSASYGSKNSGSVAPATDDKQHGGGNYSQPPPSSGGWGGAQPMTRQPLLSSQPPQAQQQMRYRMDSRHTNSESDGGWNAPLNNYHSANVPSQTNRRGFTQPPPSSIGTSSQTGWYGNGGNGNNNGANNYPPSLLSLETGVMDAYDNSGGANSARFGGGRAHGHYPAHGTADGRPSVPRNGPVTAVYAANTADDHFAGRGSGVDIGDAHSGIQKMKSNTATQQRRALGAELSSASENDSHSGAAASGGYLGGEKYGFLDNEQGEFANDRQKGLWDRSSGNYNAGQQRGGASQQYKNTGAKSGEPQFRMLKRNDEKSAEYFAYYSTANDLSSDSPDVGEKVGGNAVPPDENFDNGTMGFSSFGTSSHAGHHQAHVKKPLLSHKPGEAADTFDGAATVPPGGFNRDLNNHRESQSPRGGGYYQNKKNGSNAQQNFDTSKPNQNFGGGATVHPTQQINQATTQPQQQQQQKFNRAPGGGKSLQNQQHHTQRGGQRHQQQPQITESATNSPAATSTVAAGDRSNAAAAIESGKTESAAATKAPPIENIWEKRKEERQSSERKNLQQAKQNRQFDYHFPSMADAVKVEPGAVAAEELESSQMRGSRNQDVRLDQKGGENGRNNFSNGRGSLHNTNQWNPPAPNGGESHWDELATAPVASSKSNVPPGGERRGGNRRTDAQRQRGGNETAGGGDGLFSSRNNTYEGTRREFVNSKNRGAFSKGVSSASTSRGVRGGKLRGSGSLSATGGRERRANISTGNSAVPARNASSGQFFTQATGRVETTGCVEKISEHTLDDEKLVAELAAADTLLKPNDTEQDNFSNMGEFHAEDYKIPVESAEKTNKSGQRGDKNSNRSRTDRDGKTRRGGANKRGTDSQTRRRSRQGRNPPAPSLFGEQRVWRGNASTDVLDKPEKNDGELVGLEESADVGVRPGSKDGDSTIPLIASEGNFGEAPENAQNQTQDQRSNSGGQRSTNSRRISGRTIHPTQTRVAGGGSRFVQRQRPTGANSRQKDKFTANNGGSGEHPPNVAALNGRTLGDRTSQLKSPVISDGGPEEWETASESSGFGRADENGQQQNNAGQNAASTHPRNSAERDNARKVNGIANMNGNRSGNNRRANNDVDDSSQPRQQSLQKSSVQQQQKFAGQKNAKPASHTFQSNAESASNNKANNNSSSFNATKGNNKRSNAEGGHTLNSQEKNARDGRKGTSASFPVRDGLAGVDINDASVVIIEHHPDVFFGGSESGDFEEVLSKRSKRQRLQQMEEERKKLEREKERQEKLLAKRSKQQQRRAEKTAAKKAVGDKKEKVVGERITVFTNQNFAAQGVGATDVAAPHSFTSAKSNSSANDGRNNFAGVNADNIFHTEDPSYLTQISATVQKSTTTTVTTMNRLVGGTIPTGFDEIAMTTVWNSSLSAAGGVPTSNNGAPSSNNNNLSSSNIANLTLESSSSYSAPNTTTVIPSPIARPVPKNANNVPTPVSSATTTTNGSWSLTAGGNEDDGSQFASVKENYDFTFDPSLKGKNGSVESADKPIKSHYENLRGSCSPGGGVPTSGGSPAGALHGKNSSENSDHAQLQKKLDRVKNFWPGSSSDSVTPLSAAGLLTNSVNSGTTADSSQRSNVAKVRPQPHGIASGDEPMTNSSTAERISQPPSDPTQVCSYSTLSSNFVSPNGQFYASNTMGNKTIGMKPPYGGSNRSAGIGFVEIGTSGGFLPASSATPQSPIGSAVFGNPLALGGLQSGNVQGSSQFGALPPYSIMFRNGDFLTQQPIMPQHPHHTANSPPTQHIVGQASGGIIGAQRSSRPNSFVEHALIMTHAQQPNSINGAVTPWSTGGGFEFLNGIGATPPPMSAPTPGSAVGRSSIPPTVQAPAYHSAQTAMGQSFMPPPSMVPPSKVPPHSGGRMGAVNLSMGGYNAAGGGAMGGPHGGNSGGILAAVNGPPNFQHHPPPAAHHHQMTHTVPLPTASGIFGAPSSNLQMAPGKPPQLLNGVAPMTIPPPPLAAAHLPPPHPHMPPLQMAPPPHGAFMPPPGMDWSTMQVSGGNGGASMRNSNSASQPQMPNKQQQFPPPPFLPPMDNHGAVGQYHNSNGFGIPPQQGMPLNFTAPPPSLNNLAQNNMTSTASNSYRPGAATMRNSQFAQRYSHEDFKNHTNKVRNESDPKANAATSTIGGANSSPFESDKASGKHEATAKVDQLKPVGGNAKADSEQARGSSTTTTAQKLGGSEERARISTTDEKANGSVRTVGGSASTYGLFDIENLKFSAAATGGGNTVSSSTVA